MASRNPKRNIVLCVDDEVILSVLQAALELYGYAFVAAHSGGEALELAAELRPDAVIFDHHLPDMTGGKLATKMKRIRPDIVIILFSGSPAPPPDAVGFVDAFVQKSEGIRPLVAVLQRMLGRSQPETRRFPRYPVRLPLAISVDRFGELAVLSGLCRNFSEGGIAARIDGTLVPGEFVEVQVSDSRLNFGFKSSAQVCHRTGRTYGFAFLDITPSQKLDVQRLCQRLASL